MIVVKWIIGIKNSHVYMCIHVCMHKHECVCVLCVHMSALLHVSVGVHAPKLYVYQAKNGFVCQSSTPTLYESHLGCFLLCMLDQLAHEIWGFCCLHPRITEKYYCVWLLHGLEIWTYVLKCSNEQCSCPGSVIVMKWVFKSYRGIQNFISMSAYWSIANNREKL